MKVYVLTEGQTDARLFGLLLRNRSETEFTVVPAGGKSATISLGQSMLIARQQPVALIIDADSISPEGIREQELLYHDMLSSPSMGTPFLLLLAVPEIEYVFFESKAILARAGIALTEREAADARYHPKQVLDGLLRKKDWSRSEFFSQLPPSALEEMAKLPLAAELIEFIRRPQGFRSWSNAKSWVG
jgi:hypothetical protein